MEDEPTLKHLMAMCVAASTVMAGQTGLTVPTSLLAAAKQSPAEFVMALANTSIPAGLEIRESDDVKPSRRPAYDIDSKETVALAELVESFNAQHRDYRAVVTRGGVTVVRPVKGTLPFLDQPSSLSHAVTVTGVTAALRRVFSPLTPGRTGPILNSLGRKGEDIPVVVDGSGGRTVIDTLNQIVVQAPGRAWMVTTQQEQDAVRVISFGFIEADGSRSASAAGR
jgi:hypothetical protein